jgi:DNA-directed RNA polymerase specialized sigma24 family protein
VHVLEEDVSRKESILTPAALSGLLEWLDDGVDSHGERYLEMHRRLVSYFDRHNQLAADALADETLGRIAATLQQTRVTGTTPGRYCYGVARIVLREESIAGSDDDQTLGTHRPDCLDRCLQELLPEERELIVEYYGDARRQGTDLRRDMAKRMGIAESALSLRAVRIREALMNRVTSCWGATR